MIISRALAEEYSEVIQERYAAAMTRRRSYVYEGLGASCAHPESELRAWTPGSEENLAEVGCLCGFTHGDVFAVSHFAPAGLRAGVDLLIDAWASTNFKFVFAVTEDLVPQLQRIGFLPVAETVQEFGGAMQRKIVCVALRQWARDLKSLAQMTLKMKEESWC